MTDRDAIGDRRTTRTRPVWAYLVAWTAVLPLVVLPIRAFADVWRAPALVPQRWGPRGST